VRAFIGHVSEQADNAHGHDEANRVLAFLVCHFLSLKRFDGVVYISRFCFPRRFELSTKPNLIVRRNYGVW
jgi:hypothetical protein